MLVLAVNSGHYVLLQRPWVMQKVKSKRLIWILEHLWVLTLSCVGYFLRTESVGRGAYMPTDVKLSEPPYKYFAICFIGQFSGRFMITICNLFDITFELICCSILNCKCTSILSNAIIWFSYCLCNKLSRGNNWIQEVS